MAFSCITEDDTNADNELIVDARTEKFNRIRECEARGSIWELREMALSPGGLVNAELRQRIWPLLVGLSQDEPWLEEAAKLFEPSTQFCTEPEDRERDLIRRDVSRSVLFHHSCPSPNSVMGSFDEASIESKAELSVAKLAAVLTTTISFPLTPNDDEKPHYYQGLHDLGGVLLENLEYNEVFTTAILRRLCSTHLRDNTKATFEDLKWFLSSSLMKVLSMVDPQIYQAMVESGLDGLLPLTLVKWLFTWFTHSIHGEEEASRLVDAFIASHPLLPFYVSIAFLVHPRLRREILTAEWDDPSSVNMAIHNLPMQIRSDWRNDSCYVTTQELIDTAVSIMKQVPPQLVLQMVDDPDRAGKMTLMKALPSLDTGTPDPSNSCSRAKMASGIPVLMQQAQQADMTWLKPFGPPIVHRPKAQRPATLKKRLRLLSRSTAQRLRVTIRSFVLWLPQNKLNRVALAWGTFVAIFAVCRLVFDFYLLFSSSPAPSEQSFSEAEQWAEEL